MSKIIPQLWLDREAIEAADFYLSIFPDSRKLRRTKLEDAPCGEYDSRSIELMGQEFMLVCAGSDYSINSSISFLIECTSQEETYAIFAKLLENEDELEAIEDYDFNQINRLEDRYGISWMIQYQPTLPTQRITPVLLFVGSAFGKAEEAVKFYVSVFKDASLDEHWLVNDELDQQDRVFNTQIHFTLEGQTFRAFEKFAMEEYLFTKGVSFLISADTQAEIERYWNALSSVTDAELGGWLQDKFGFFWQVSSRLVDAIPETETEVD